MCRGPTVGHRDKCLRPRRRAGQAWLHRSVTSTSTHICRAWPAPIVRPEEEGEMRVVGIDTHKATLAACAIDDVGQVLGEQTFPNEPVGFAALLAWLGELGDVSRIGLEGSAGYGAGAA